MKIRDLNLDDYVIVYDIGKSEHSEGMTVVGRVVDLIFNEYDDNEARIVSLGCLYKITDDNYLDLWSNYIENKTENLSDKSILKVGLGVSKPATEYKQSNDVQQRKRNEQNTALFKIVDLKVGYKIKILGEEMTGEVTEITNNGKTAEIQVDDGVYRVINDNYDFTIIEWNAVPKYAEDTVNHPSHYNYGEIEVIDYCDQVCKTYPPELAPYVFNAIKYLSRANYKNGQEDIAKAKYFVQRLFDKWE
ncbi:DUF3310 domain-containing protein [Staphylococcus sp. KY49P]|nr:DUF3310 domain-containing protein [Staphylococcus sp. KY49P]